MTEKWRPEFNVHDTNVISVEDQIWLQGSFEDEQVWECIKSCAIDKAPGPVGFNMNFFQLFGT